MMSEKRLFGLESAESLYDSIAGCYEAEIIDDYDAGAEVVVAEWTVADNRTFLGRAVDVIDFVLETAADEAVVEGWYEEADRLARDPKVIKAFEKALQLMADKMTFWMTDQFVGHHIVVTGDVPMVDGEPMYVKRGESEL